jgi:hypothetical protein
MGLVVTVVALPALLAIVAAQAFSANPETTICAAPVND